MHVFYYPFIERIGIKMRYTKRNEEILKRGQQEKKIFILLQEYINLRK